MKAPGYRRSAHGHARRPRDPDQRPRRHRGSRDQARLPDARGPRPGEEGHDRQGHDDHHRGCRQPGGDRRPRQAAADADRRLLLRLRPREAPGAPGQARRRGGDHQGRRGDRDGNEGEEGAASKTRCTRPRRRSKRGSSRAEESRCCGQSAVLRSLALEGDEQVGVRDRRAGHRGTDALDRHQRRARGIDCRRSARRR